MIYTDETLMPFGKHRGTPLKDVPASYLLWINDNISDLHENFKKYINCNKHILEIEVIAEKQNRRLEKR